MCLKDTLGENPGSGHSYFAKNRTFLLCVDTLECGGLPRLFGPKAGKLTLQRLTAIPVKLVLDEARERLRDSRYANPAVSH